MRDRAVVRPLIQMAATLALLAVIFGACGPIATASPSLTPTSGGLKANVAQAAGLLDTTRIELYEFTSSGYYWRTTISVATEVGAIIIGLDRPIELGPRVRCPDRFHAHFAQASGTRVILGLVCADLPEFVRGAQAFWHDRDGRLPSEVAQVIAAAVAAAPALHALAADEVVQQIVAELVRAHPDLEPFAAYDWRRADLAPAPTLGERERWLYASAEWVVEVAWLPGPNVIFEVSVTVPSAGFTWTGRGPAGAVAETTPAP